MKNILYICLFFTVHLNASVLAIKVVNTISYKNGIYPKDLKQVYVNNIKSSCIPLTKEDIMSNEYKAKVFLKIGKILCKKDVYIAKNNRIVFNFGSIQIEREGKVIKETSEYIRIRNANGKIEKIYKDGRP